MVHSDFWSILLRKFFCRATVSSYPMAHGAAVSPKFGIKLILCINVQLEFSRLKWFVLKVQSWKLIFFLRNSLKFRKKIGSRFLSIFFLFCFADSEGTQLRLIFLNFILSMLLSDFSGVGSSSRRCLSGRYVPVVGFEGCLLPSDVVLHWSSQLLR